MGSQGRIEQAPQDDVGAETLGRFRYQAELAARYAIAMLAGEPIARIYCELHEDYLVVFDDGRRPCLVSVKHLEASQPRWTLRALCEDGGVAHLCSRWEYTDRSTTCLLQTNSGLKGGAGEAGQLAEACKRGDIEELAHWGALIAPFMGAATEDDCASFLSCLRVEDRLPDRPHLRSSNLIEFMPACLAALGHDSLSASVVHGVIVAEIERASRNELPDGARLAMSDPDRMEISGALRSKLDAKMITLDRLKAALDKHFAKRSPLLGILVDTPPTGSHRLATKLERGGVGPTGVRNAQNLRLNWLGHCSRWSPGLPRAIDPFDDVSSRVLSAAHSAESAVRLEAGQYAPAMEAELIEILERSSISLPGDPTSDIRLLLGCAYALTNDCHIYWSDEFDVGEPA